MRISDWSSDVCSSDLLSEPCCRHQDATALPGGISVLRKGRSSVHQVRRSEEHTSELQSLMRISYAVFCLKKKNTTRDSIHIITRTRTAVQYLTIASLKLIHTIL